MLLVASSIRFDERSHIVCFRYKRLESNLFLWEKSSHWKIPSEYFMLKLSEDAAALAHHTSHLVWVVCFFLFFFNQDTFPFSLSALLNWFISHIGVCVCLADCVFAINKCILLISCTLSVRYESSSLGLFLARALQLWCCQFPLLHTRKY